MVPLLLVLHPLLIPKWRWVPELMEAWESKPPLSIPGSCFYVPQVCLLTQLFLPLCFHVCLGGNQSCLLQNRPRTGLTIHKDCPQPAFSTSSLYLMQCPLNRAPGYPCFSLNVPSPPGRVARMNLWEGQLHCAALPQGFSSHACEALHLPLLPCLLLPASPFPPP